MHDMKLEWMKRQAESGEVSSSLSFPIYYIIQQTWMENPLGVQPGLSSVTAGD